MKKSYLSLATLTLALTFLFNNNALAQTYDGTGTISCDSTFTISDGSMTMKEQAFFDIDITKPEELEGQYELTVSSFDPLDGELIELDRATATSKKTGKKYVLVTEGIDDEDGTTYYARYTYPRAGGKAQIHVREEGGTWINLAKFHMSEDDFKIKIKTHCNFTPAN